jgi:hypothetical protein
MVSVRQTGTTITWAYFAGRIRTPRKVSSCFLLRVLRTPSPPRWRRQARGNLRIVSLTGSTTSVGTATRSTPKGFAESIATSVGTGDAKRAPLRNFGDGVAKFATRTFGVHPALGQDGVWTREPRFATRNRSTPAASIPVNSSQRLGSPTPRPEQSAHHLRVTTGAGCAVRRPSPGCSCPAHTPHDPGPEKGMRRLAAAVILCSGAEGHGRWDPRVLACSGSTQESEDLKADPQN